MNQNVDIEKVYKHWVDSAEKDYGTMLRMYETKDFHWSLFIGHIVLEKIINASVVKSQNKHAPFTHDLTKLASKSGIDFSEEQLDWLDTVTTFNLNARYDSYKQAFYKKCTPEFTNEWLEKIKNLYSWIKNMQ